MDFFLDVVAIPLMYLHGVVAGWVLGASWVMRTLDKEGL